MADVLRRHRADYILEQGTWRATCQVCGHFVRDPLRRRAASLFRSHIRDASAAEQSPNTEIIDLRAGAQIIDLRAQGSVADTQIRI